MTIIEHLTRNVMQKLIARLLTTRTAVVLLLAILGSTAALADELTEKEALEVAQQFVLRHRNTKSAPKLTAEGQVSGLYVFNVSNNGGFVIVSNDDRTTPVLGFADSGSLDVKAIPDNMRAWLQGYADEIAWLQAQGTKSRQHMPSGLRKVQRREQETTAPSPSSPWTPGEAKTDIEPLVKAKWDQDSPYNGLTPYYKRVNGRYTYSSSYQEGYSHCATGCVATAMAQVMHYHQWPTDATTAIPYYYWTSYIYLPANGEPLPATTFDWANMLLEYKGKDPETGMTTVLGNEAQQQAVATLMQYCGYSVQMDYGPESGAYTPDIATALTKYFDYNKNTVQYVSRSYYTYANWVDLMYFELANRRPVLFGGMSTGGGHEFVCDGYQYDSQNNTDFFHINWGWGGRSDHYFVLSALDPELQGIGGSTSTDGFNVGQEAVIGIQPSSANGPMSGIQPNTVNLTLKAISLSSSTIALGESVQVTMTMYNESNDPYDGELCLLVNDYLDVEKMFLIPAKTTQDCVIDFKPTDVGSYRIYCAIPFPNGYYGYYDDYYVTLDVVDVVLADNATDNSSVVASNNGKQVSIGLKNRRLIKDGAWNTLCLPFSLSALEGSPLEGATVMELDANGTYALNGSPDENGPYKTGLAADGTLYLYFKTANSIVAGTPYIIMWETTESTELTDLVFSDVTIDETMHPVNFDGGSFIGTYNSLTFTQKDEDILLLGAGNSLYYPNPSGGQNPTVGAHRAYFTLNEPATARAFKVSFYDGQGGAAWSSDEASAIEEIGNGQPSEGVWLSLDGRKVGSPLKKGVYIYRPAGGRLQGKKVIIH